MRTVAEILADVEPGVAEELTRAIELVRRTAHNAGVSSAWAEARRSFDGKRDEFAAALAEAIATERAKLENITTERDAAVAELARFRAASTEAELGAARMRSIVAGRGR